MQISEVIPVFKPLLEEAEFDACRLALENGWLGMGSFVGDFEQAIADSIGTNRHVVAVSTGHAALHLTLMLMGLQPGDEVITPSFNNIADLQAIRATGAEPVFCDIDPRTLCIDTDSAEALISPRTKAIIAMDYAFHFCDHEKVAELAQRYHLRVLHDAAHSFGSSYKDNKIGSFSDVTIFSFDPVKNITTIDGGAIIVKTAEEAQWLREARLIGMGQPAEVMYQDQRAWTYDVQRLGFRYHMANLHAALGLSQIRKLDLIRASRRQVCNTYQNEFSRISGLRTPGEVGSDVIPFIYYLRVAEERRQSFRDHLHDHGVDTGIHWQPGHWFSYFKGCRKGRLDVTDQIGREIVTIPLHSKMDSCSVNQVIRAVKTFFE
jgi:dTDP-4-amino-4,6-dideoxygalactose transaminase